MGWCEAALRGRLESPTIRILRDITSLVVDDSLHERRQSFVLRQQRMVMRELVRRVSKPLGTDEISKNDAVTSSVARRHT